MTTKPAPSVDVKPREGWIEILHGGIDDEVGSMRRMWNERN